MSESSLAPHWFRRALAHQPDLHCLNVDGVPLTVRTWGDHSAPPIVLLHGGAAHAAWWDHVAPLLTDSYRVLALDLSGHGDSGWRSSYDIGLWADEVEAVIDSDLHSGRPVVAGHSMGGLIAAEVGLRRGADLRGLILLDSQFPPRGFELSRPAGAETRAGNARRVDPDRERLLGRFRLIPEEARLPQWMTRHIAELSVAPVDGGWSWKFDPRFFDHDFRHLEGLAPVGCPVAVVHADRGIVSRELSADIGARLGSTDPPLTVHDSGHHVQLEQPFQVTAILASLAGEWYGGTVGRGPHVRPTSRRRNDERAP